MAGTPAATAKRSVVHRKRLMINANKRRTVIIRFETRSLPKLTRFYPRRFTFYVADPSAPFAKATAFKSPATTNGGSACSLFEKAMRINDTLAGFSSGQTIEQFHQARLVRITHRRFSIWLDPFGMLDPKVVVNLLPELCVRVDLIMRGPRPGGRSVAGTGWFVQFGALAAAFHSKTNEFHKRLSIGVDCSKSARNEEPSS